MKVVAIFGTRPEAIKMAPVIRQLKKCREIESKVCVTAQHREMLDQVLKLFEIRSDYDLGVMQENQTLFDVTSRVLPALERVLKAEHPDMILVQGDTTTAFVASLAAYYLKIKLAHIEAGLRTGDKFNPFPEEINRKLIDVLSDLFFVPTKTAKDNLLKEGVEESNIFITGNTAVDALLSVINHSSWVKTQRKMGKLFLKNYGLSPNEARLILVTGHRRESFGRGLENICNALKQIVERNADLEVIYPVHLNPNVQDPVNRILGDIEKIHLIEPLGYLPFIWLMSKAYLILTDSGGVQEEAPSLGKPVLVMRDKTERIEAIEAGTAKLVGTESKSIFLHTQSLLENKDAYEEMTTAINPFGDGRAAERIVKILRQLL